MRNFIIGLSILFFVLSGLITFKAVGIPLKNASHQNNAKGLNSKDLPPKPEDISGQRVKEQTDNQSLVKELQATIVMLEDKLSDKNKENPAKAETEESKKQARIIDVIGDGAFRSGQVAVDENLINEVKKVVPDILASPNYSVIIEGHTDNIPIKSSTGKQYMDNMELSFLRAKAVASILVESGISREHISVIGYGETRPIASNETDEGRVKNRRVVIKLIPGDKEF